MKKIKGQIIELLSQAGVAGEIELTVPPKPEMGDLSFACFGLAKEWKKSPVEAARELAVRLLAVISASSTVIPAKAGIHGGDVDDVADSRFRGNDKKGCGDDVLIEKVEAVGPYVNFFLNAKVLAEAVLSEACDKHFGESKLGKGKKIMVEYAQPNTHKAFHIGHLRNIITGESLSRIFENAGYKVIRANYQGDVGLHIAKCLYGIFNNGNWKLEIRNLKSIEEKINFLAEAYAAGNKAYEEDIEAKKEIEDINEKIYSAVGGVIARERSDFTPAKAGGGNPTVKEIKKLYKETRAWSLKYFDKIYKRAGAKFDRLYFESETFERGKKLVLENLKKGIFKESEGAIIFEGEKFGLHNRVFLTQKGLPTYEAKDLALAELQLKKKPDAIFHVVGKEQTEYFRVLFKAIEQVFPKTAGKENHLVYGWVSLKEGKMSSRSGKVILGEWLLDVVKEKIAEVMKEHKIKNRDEVMEKVAVAAVKYMFLRTSAANDIVFGLEESVSLTGDSGPYLLYIVARIKSILKKSKNNNCHSCESRNLGRIKIPAFAGMTKLAEWITTQEEKKLLLDMVNFSEATAKAAIERDPSKIAHYLLNLAQDFNIFYAACPILQSEGAMRDFRLGLIKAVKKTMTKGLYLLGIEAVEEM